MSESLAGRRIALAEGRQLEELAAALENEGATALRYPLLSILDAPDSAPVVDWIRDLIAGQFAYVILMTGEAVRRLLAVSEREGMRDEFVAALGRTRTMTRGPKPARALKEIGFLPGKAAAIPTTEGVIASLRSESLSGSVVGFTLAGAPNPALEQFLVSAGARPRPVLSYVYAPASTAERVAELIARVADGGVDVLIFTSSPQVDRLFEVAREIGAEAKLNAGLQRVRVAAVGPVVAEALRTRGQRVDICPEQGWVMKNLVQHIKRVMQSA
jgi:uroporphyrinogen-III synthase